MSEGVHNMFLYGNSNTVTPMNDAGMEEWLQQAVLVFEGEYAMDIDKKALVDTVLGLYAIALTNAEDDDDGLRPSVRRMCFAALAAHFA